MKNLKIRLGIFSLLAVLAVSVFLTSCEQETVVTNQTSDEIQEMMSRMIQDADVSTFIDATREFNNALRDRIEANQEQYDAYALANDNDGISELIEFDEISDLFEQMLRAGSVVSAKFPKIDAIDEKSIEKFYLNNPQFSETGYNNYQSTELESRSCSWWEVLLENLCETTCAKTYLNPVWPNWSDIDGYNNCIMDNCDFC